MNCLICDVDISHRNKLTKYCLPCGNDVRKNQDKTYKQTKKANGKDYSRHYNLVYHPTRRCLCCNGRVRERRSVINSARLCLPCKHKNIDMGDMCEGMPADTGTVWSQEETLI